MKLPRDLSGDDLARALTAPLRVGTLASILDDVAAHFGVTRSELLARIKI
ncbi:MAG TPA: hypothetical protein VER32_00265 [Pyrinomonadaceae bacterium]|nr:hypothetical protein [Pyrinomonadaceae bacterium]